MSSSGRSGVDDRPAAVVQREVILTGIGGQGVQLCAKVLALAATAEGRRAMLAASYGGEMRGGRTEASVVLADGPLRALPILPSTWSALVLHPNHWPSVARRLRPGGPVVYNSDIVADALMAEGVRACPVAAATIAGGLGAPMSAGFVLLGAYAALTAVVTTASLAAAMGTLVPAYRREHVAANTAALEAGAAAVGPGSIPAWILDGPAPPVPVVGPKAGRRC